MQKTRFDRGFLSGFIVLAAVVFTVGFLAGMLAYAELKIPFDSATLALTVFVFGLLTGMVTVAIIVVISTLSRLQTAGAKN